MKTKLCLMFCLSFFAWNAYADNIPFKVSTGMKEFNYHMLHNKWRTVTITSLSDDLVINKVTVDRNHCISEKGNGVNKLNDSGQSYKLAFGKKVVYQYDRQCSAVEIVVETNLGSWTFN